MQIQKLNNVGTVTNSLSSLFQTLDDLDKFAEYIINSDTYGKAFEKEVEDEKGKKTKIRNKHDVVACVLLGADMGLTPMAAITLGKQLNQNSYFSVLKGRSMNLDPITSIQNIYNISTSRGSILYTGVHIITSTIIKSGTIIEFLEDYVRVPIYRDSKSNVIQYEDLLDNTGNVDSRFFIASSLSLAAEVKAASEAGKVLIAKSLSNDRRTTIKFTRPLIGQTITKSYSLQEATDAGLYMGYHSELCDTKNKPLAIEGKDNWNKHPRVMLTNRVLAIGGRIIASDMLNGIYLPEEAKEIADTIYRLINKLDKMKE